ncbi:MAG: helix-turn-helix transcriptional regulator, partial [Bacteroidota bacterium]
MSDKEKIKLIFAFKIKYLRQQKGLSYQQLKEATGLSTSYLHDIEKGTKYPKIDKITALAKAFGVDYNELVSTTASKKIQPIIDLLHSDFLKVFPLEMFGLDIYRLFEMFSNTPEKVNA